MTLENRNDVIWRWLEKESVVAERLIDILNDEQEPRTQDDNDATRETRVSRVSVERDFLKLPCHHNFCSPHYYQTTLFP